jgi:RNA-binding protein 5/10
MAYNRDRGKDSWNNANYDHNDSSSWHDGGRENIRPREEDYYNEGKRRKYNNGVCLNLHWRVYLKLKLPQGYDASQPYEETSYDTGYGQNDHGQDYSNDDRSQHRGFSKKRLVPSEPSPHVIFLGLDPDFTEADVCRLPLINTIIAPITE